MSKRLTAIVILAVLLSATAIALVPSDMIQKKNATAPLDLSGVAVDFNSSAFAIEPLGGGRLTDGINNTAEFGNNSTMTLGIENF